MAITKSLTKIGNSYGIILPNALLKAAGLTAKSRVEINLKGDELTIRPTNLKEYRTMKVFLSVVRDFDPLLKKLAKST